MSFPANQFLLRQRGGRPYYVYADPAGCSCAYVGSVNAMNNYRAAFGALPPQMSGGFTDPEQNMINSMEKDDGERSSMRTFPIPGSELAHYTRLDKLAVLAVIA
jgi:hypothetical protein